MIEKRKMLSNFHERKETPHPDVLPVPRVRTVRPPMHERKYREESIVLSGLFSRDESQFDVSSMSFLSLERRVRERLNLLFPLISSQLGVSLSSWTVPSPLKISLCCRCCREIFWEWKLRHTPSRRWLVCLTFSHKFSPSDILNTSL